ncbi:MAG: NAD-dependent epimerase/dehydratase family protein [Firmicutes bacterium]|nr:NAD-dependent epimerase/dehydratase family protein [Bacillota bacterium]
MRVVVTGGAGFIGSHTVDLLLQQGFDVIVLDNLSTGSRENLPQDVRLVVRDVRDPGLAGLFREIRPDAVVHLAAQVSVARSVANPLEDAQINIEGLLNVAKALDACGGGRLVFSSSAAVYGSNPNFPLQEEEPVQPTSPYGIAKAAGEMYLRSLSQGVDGQKAGWDFVILRYANVYGPRQSVAGEAGVVAAFAWRLAEGKMPVIYGDGSQTRDFVFVEDVARANLAALTVPCAGGMLCNISSQQDISILGLLELMIQAAKSLRMAPWHAQAGPVVPAFGPPRPGDLCASLLDRTRAQKVLNWCPRVSLPDGLSKTLEWFRHRQERSRLAI